MNKKYIKQDLKVIYASLMILPMIEKTYSRPHEIYTISGLELLQREINHFKEKIKFDELMIK